MYLTFLYVRVMIYVISNQVSGHVYARFPFVCSIRDGGPAPQVQNLSWAIVLFKNKVAHQSCELDMKHHTTLICMDYDHMKMVVIVRKVLRVFSTITRSVGPLGLGWSPTFNGGSP